MESLAVKYRPAGFYSVVGQEKTIAILQNQLRSKDTKQGYLFCGGAGTGKTTIARIFANEINSREGDKVGDIIEIDAASNNGVDSVRELRETCKFKPLNGGFKVYIIDEVHMLSTGAFNALLKTLEEPPAHCVFILCTTDPHKIPATILSRVQRFDFKRMTSEQVIGRLRQIISMENDEADPTGGADLYEVDPTAFEYLAKLSAGGMRDAISLLDTCLGYGGVLTAERVAEILGVPSYEQFLEILGAMLNKDSKQVIMEIEVAHTSGKDVKQYLKGLTEFVVELRKLNAMGEMEYVNVPPMYKEKMEQFIEQAGDEWLCEKFNTLLAIMSVIKYEPQPKALVEGALIAW